MCKRVHFKNRLDMALVVIMYNVQRCMSLSSTSMARNSSITTCGTMELPRAAMAFFLHPRKGRVRPGIPEESPSSPSQTAATVGKFRHQPCGLSVPLHWVLATDSFLQPLPMLVALLHFCSMICLYVLPLCLLLSVWATNPHPISSVWRSDGTSRNNNRLD